MIPVEEKDNYYSVKKVLDLVGISESHFRRILKEFREYIPTKKGMRNKDLFSLSSIKTIKSIVEYKKLSLSKDDIICYLQKSNSVARSRLETPEFLKKTTIEKFSKDETGAEIYNLMMELSSKCRTQDKRIGSLKKTLNKRTETYRKDMKELNEVLDKYKRELDIVSEKMILMEREKLDWEKKGFFRKLMGLFS